MFRGVAQPGRAPGSGPGGRRFKSSLPDHYFQSLTINFWSAALIDVGEIEAAKASKINKRRFLNESFCAQRNKVVGSSFGSLTITHQQGANRNDERRSVLLPPLGR
jgi:hypothetical protein